MRIAAAENIARYDQDTTIDSSSYKFRAGAPGSLRKEVERAARFDELEAIFQTRDQHVAFLGVIAAITSHIDVQSGQRGPLGRLRCTNEAVLLELDHRLDNRPRSVHPANAPARHGVALGKPIVQFDLTEGRVSAQQASLYARNNDEIDFAKKLLELLDNDELRREMGEFGRQRVLTELQWKHEIPNLLQAYDVLFGSGTATTAASMMR